MGFVEASSVESYPSDQPQKSDIGLVESVQNSWRKLERPHLQSAQFQHGMQHRRFGTIAPVQDRTGKMGLGR